MLIHKKTIVILVSLIVAATIWVGAATNLVDQHGVLSGRVVSQNLVAVGVFVKEGAVLANVESITGAAPAARATRDGVVREVLVKPGDIVRAGQVIARIEPVVK